MATGKVRIFELAKELNMSSKDMIALFGRLGLEAKNQLSVVEPKGVARVSEPDDEAHGL